MPTEFTDFHFLRPLWLLAIVPLLAIVFALRSAKKQQSGWQGVIASHLYTRLVTAEGSQSNTPPFYLLGIGWIVACFALAGPTWERLPQPVYQLHTGKVVIIDMTLSMRATDTKPNRLSRAKFKAIDLVKQVGEGEIGLIAYAGDAFVISPLSSDVQNLTALIPSLSPEIMPTPGSEPLYAFEEAITLLTNSGYQKGDIFWITDGIDLDQVAPITQLLSAHQYRVSVLGVGTENGAPIKLANNQLLKDARGSIVIPRFNNNPLKIIASKNAGRYTGMQADDSDIRYLAQLELLDRETQEQAQQQDNQFGDQWQEKGPYLVILLLPFAAYAFRRGMLALVLLILLPSYPQPAQAGWWENMWQRPDQQGMQSFNAEDFASATEQFDNPMWKGSAAYKNGDFATAAEEFAKFDTPDANYNRGNALAKSGDIEGAIEAYNKVLSNNPDHEDAATNKALLEQMQDQQNQDQQNQDQQNQDQQNQDQQNQDQQNQNQQNQNQQNQDQNGESDNQQDQQNQSGDQSEQDQQSDSEQQAENNQQQNEASQEQNSSESQQDPAKQEQSEQEQSQSEQQNAQAEQNDENGEENQEDQARKQPVSNVQPEELTDEQKEQMEKMQNWLRKVPDDPAYLLKRKMLIEKENRRRQRVPSQSQRNW